MKTPESPSRFRMRMRGLQSLLILGGLFCIHILRRDMAANPPQPGGTDIERQQSSPDSAQAPVFDSTTFSARVREAGARSDTRLAGAERQFLSRLRELQNHQGFLQWMENTAIKSGQQMNDNKDLLNLIRYSALDRIQGTHRVDTWVEGRLHGQVAPWLNAFTQELHLAAVELDRALTASREELAYDLAVAAHETHAPMAVLNPEVLGKELLNVSPGRIAVGGGLIVALSPLEIHGLVTSPLLRRIPAAVARLVARTFSKQVGVAVAAGSSTVVDGPLPIGDIVGGVLLIGGTVWTIAEWNGLKRDLQENVTSNVRTELCSVRNQGIRVIREQGGMQIAQTRQIQQVLLARAHEEETKQVAVR